MRKAIAHLDSDQVENLMQKYYDGEKISDLLREYQIVAPASALVSFFPLFVHQDLFCPYCESVNMVSK